MTPCISNYERSEAQRIRDKYTVKTDTAFRRLKRLDKKVKRPGKIIAAVMAIGGALLMGTGMSQIIVWDIVKTGLLMGIPGMAAAILAPFVYRLVTGTRRKKYAEQIFALSDEVI